MERGVVQNGNGDERGAKKPKLDTNCDQGQIGKDVKIRESLEGSNEMAVGFGVDQGRAAENLTIAVHPLEKHWMLQLLFDPGEMSLEELKRNRLVCRAWRDFLERTWFEATKTLTLYRRAKDIPYYVLIGKPSAHRMALEQLRAFCNDQVTPEFPLQRVVPYRKFQLKGWTFDAALDQLINNRLATSPGVDQWFWTTISPKLITKLTLNGGTFQEQISCFTEHFLRALPHLKELVLKKSSTSMRVLSNYGPQQLPGNQLPANVYQNPHLKSVKVALDWPGEGMIIAFAEFTRMTPFLQEITFTGNYLSSAFVENLRRCPQIKSLQQLDILDFSNQSHLECVVNWDVNFYNFENLLELKLDIGESQASAMLCLILIQDRAPAVQKLTLYRSPAQPAPNSVWYPEWHNLTELILWGNVWSSLDFLEYMPSLKVLIWKTSCFHGKHGGERIRFRGGIPGGPRMFSLIRTDLVAATSRNLKMDSLTKLDVDFGPLANCSWARLGEWMPKLEKLKVLVNGEEQLGMIREQWEY